MPTAMTYNSLLNDLRAYLERGATLATDPTVYEQLPQLINMAERRLARELKVQGTINVVNSTFIIGDSVYAKPAQPSLARLASTRITIITTG